MDTVKISMNPVRLGNKPFALAVCMLCSFPLAVDAGDNESPGVEQVAGETTESSLFAAPQAFTRQFSGVYWVDSVTENTAGCSAPGEALQATEPYVAVQYIGGGPHLLLATTARCIHVGRCARKVNRMTSPSRRTAEGSKRTS
jgi:hypothetical protein